MGSWPDFGLVEVTADFSKNIVAATWTWALKCVATWTAFIAPSGIPSLNIISSTLKCGNSINEEYRAMWTLMEMELSLISDLLYNKAGVIQTWSGYRIHVISALAITASLLLFNSQQRCTEKIAHYCHLHLLGWGLDPWDRIALESTRINLGICLPLHDGVGFDIMLCA